MEYNRVIDKIKKLKELVDRGVDGEVFAAKRAIEQLCKKYDVNIEDLFKKDFKNSKSNVYNGSKSVS